MADTASRILSWDDVREEVSPAGYELVVDDEDGISLRGPVRDIRISRSGVLIRCEWLAVGTVEGWKLDAEAPATDSSFSFLREICSTVLAKADGTLTFRVQYTGNVRLHPPGTIRPLEKPTLVAT